MAVRSPSDLNSDPGFAKTLASLPAFLYRFSGLSGEREKWMQRLIVDSDLYFALPSTFNDPFDCRVPPRFEALPIQIEQYWKRVSRDSAHALSRAERAKRVRELIRDSRTDKGRAELSESLFRSLDAHGMVCLSSTPTNMLLWSYYAEGHTGIAVRFNMEVARRLGFGMTVLPVEVQYRKDFPDVNYFLSTTNDFINSVFGTKAIAWQHEQEWRIVSMRLQGYRRIPAELIDGVILGMRSSLSHETMIRGWLSHRRPRVELLRVTHRPGGFELDLVPA